ncbi:MAG: LacI family DNA-binding transcriptional regulator [Lachnospiraceae bacterium]|nr:LacI family DNA-binding transcriptional regulator [Lachnospiraceae bacterium]
MEQKAGNVTIRDVAKACGVSISTVSNVLNGKSNKVSDEIADKIRAEVTRMGYRPSSLARNLRATSTKTIGVLAEDLIEFSTPPIVEGIMKSCEEKGYNVVIENMRLFGRWQREWLADETLINKTLKEALPKMEALNLEGLIYVGSHEHLVHNLFSGRGLPIVMAYAVAVDKQYPTFRLDDITGGYDVIKYLVSKGHRKIGVLAGEYDNTHTINRVLGIQKAMLEEKILFDPELVIYGSWFKNGGYAGMKALLGKDITAVFCMSDLIASGAYAALYENGIVPGRDISVIGYDNQEISSGLTPELTTMALPLPEIGFQAAKAIINLIEKPGSASTDMADARIPSVLIERNSVRSI